jgi:hypothetical protein
MKATYLILVFGLFLTAAASAGLSTTTLATLSTSFTPHVVHLDGTAHAGSGDHDGDESSGWPGLRARIGPFFGTRDVAIWHGEAVKIS